MSDNPYEQPVAEANGNSDREFSTRTRVILTVVTILALVYFVAMLSVWTHAWATDKFQVLTIYDYGMFVSAAGCLVGTCISLWGLIRSRKQLTLASGFVTCLLFVSIVKGNVSNSLSLARMR